MSLHHFLNLGGSEFVVLRATPPDVQAGVRVGDLSFAAFPGSAVGLTDPSLQVAFFALPYDQDAAVPVTVFARDEAGNESTARMDRQPFPKRFQRSRIPIDRRFLDRVVPAIASNTPSLGLTVDAGADLLPAFLTINRDLRQQNNQAIAALAAKTAPEMRWQEAFAQLGNTQVESRFADHRTYFFDGKEVDQQTHLGFDLASTQQAPVTGVEPRRGRPRGLSRHLRQLRGRRSRTGRAVALRAPLVDGREGGRHRREGPDARPLGHHRAGRRRSPALHDAGRRRAGEPGRVVGSALDGGPRLPQDPRGRRQPAGPAAGR